jgi:LuxR family quorum sensing-dependent transcriptional regulator
MIEPTSKLLEVCHSQVDTSDLIALFLAATVALGFDGCAAGGWTGLGRQRVHRFYFNTWPMDWLALYEAGTFLDDPVILESQRRATPFRWSELEQYRALSPANARILDLATDYGWVDGLVIPVHGPSGYQGVVSLAAFRKLDLRMEDIALLWAASLTVHSRCRSTIGLGEEGSAVAISDRERECMRWVASGKTDADIATILSLSRSTVHFHVERVKKRLRVNSRTQAVALLVLHGVL